MRFIALVLFIFFQTLLFGQEKNILNNSLFQKSFEGEIEVHYSNAPFNKLIYLIKDSLVLRHEFPVKNYRHGFVFQFLNFASNRMDYYSGEKKLLVFRYMDTTALRNDITKKKEYFIDLKIDTTVASINCHVYEFVYTLPTSNYGINKVERVYVADTNSIASSVLDLNPGSIFFNPFFHGAIIKKINYNIEYVLTKPIDFEVVKIIRRSVSKEEVTPNPDIQIIKMNQEYGKLILTDD